MKRWIAILLLVGLCICLASCGENNNAGQTGQTESTAQTEPTQPPAGEVRILNNDPQLQAAWVSLATEYTELTGTEVAVLFSEENAVPTLRSVSGESQLPEHCADLSETTACAQLICRDLALRDDTGKVCAVAADIEIFGLVYNSTLLARSSNTKADIGSFADLTEIVYAITDDAQNLGFSAFARVAPEESFALHLATLPDGVRNLVDLIINNATCDPITMGETTEDESLQDFLDEKAVFFLATSRQQKVLDAIGSENIGVLPVYLGGENEENQTLCVAARSYWCIDESAPSQDVQATIDFLNFLIQPRADGTVPVDDLGRMAPYRQAVHVCNMLEVVLRSDLNKGLEPVVCRYVSNVPAGIKDALIAYSQNPSNDNWEAITNLTE